MTTSAGDLIARSLRSIGVIAQGRNPSEPEQDDAFSTLNELIASMNREGLLIYERSRTTHVTVASTQTYTIGLTGAIVVARPDEIESANVLIGTGQTQVERSINIIRNAREWAAIPNKNLQSTLVISLYYDATITSSRGTVYYYPIPSNVQTIALYTSTRFTQFTDISTVVLLPDGYLRYLRTNLAIELAGEYPSAQVSPLLIQQAIDSKAALKAANTKFYVLKGPAELCGPDSGYYDYRSDEVR